MKAIMVEIWYQSQKGGKIVYKNKNPSTLDVGRRVDALARQERSRMGLTV
jgi:hypothetical protein